MSMSVTLGRGGHALERTTSESWPRKVMDATGWKVWVGAGTEGRRTEAGAEGHLCHLQEGRSRWNSQGYQ